jgi:uncharacterized protein (DUF58 family)
MRRFLHAWRSLAVRQPFTRLGLAYICGMLLMALAAFVSANNLLFLILAAMLATFLASGFIGRLGLAGLELDLLLPQHTSARRRVRAGIRLRNVKKRTPSFSIHLEGAAESGFDSMLYFPVIPGGAAIEESVQVCFPRRGAQKERSFRFTTRFPFGFTERSESVTIRHEVIVYPCLDPQPGFEALLASVSGEVDAMQRGRGTDFYRIRPYEALESARHVDWRATAHTGELQVREFAREQDRAVLLYLDLDVPYGAEDWFEWAVECAAFLLYELGGRETKIRLKTQEYDATAPGTADVYTMLKYLALVSPVRGRKAAAPDDDESYQVILTANPQRLSELGWAVDRGARVLTTQDWRR